MSIIPEDIGKKYMAAWRLAAQILEEVRAKELLLSTNTTQSLISLLPAFEACVRQRKPSLTSGLIEQQRIFARARNR